MKRNKFSLSNTKLATFNMGELVPVGLTEVLPGDSIQQATSALIRVSPLNAPVMHPVHVRIHHWYVPHRLVWDDWQDFITGGPDGNNASVFPTITPNTGSGFAVGSLADYLGVPTGIDDLPVSALPFRGYSLIWNEFYRDQDLQSELTIDKTDGVDTTTNTALQNVCWEKDYFTTSRPWTQKGSQVTLPLGTTAPVVSTNTNVTLTNDVGATNRLMVLGDGGGLNNIVQGEGTSIAGHNFRWGNLTGLETDLRGATAASVNTIREAFALQRYKEARARYGSRE